MGLSLLDYSPSVMQGGLISSLSPKALTKGEKGGGVTRSIGVSWSMTTFQKLSLFNSNFFFKFEAEAGITSSRRHFVCPLSLRCSMSFLHITDRTPLGARSVATLTKFFVKSHKLQPTSRKVFY